MSNTIGQDLPIAESYEKAPFETGSYQFDLMRAEIEHAEIEQTGNFVRIAHVAETALTGLEQAEARILELEQQLDMAKQREADLVTESRILRSASKTLRLDAQTAAERYEEKEKILVAQGTTDSLTFLRNRVAFSKQFPRFVERSRGIGDLAVMIADLDNLHGINQSYGHTGGDHILKEGADGLKEIIRPGDEVWRYAGDEFVLVLAGFRRSDMQADEVEPALISRRDSAEIHLNDYLRSAAKDLELMPDEEVPYIGVTFEIGLHDGQESADDLFKRVDIDLLTRKKEKKATLAREGIYYSR